MPRGQIHGWDGLTARHYDILNLMAYDGITKSESIAAVLEASPDTTRTHIQTMLTRLQLHSRTAMVAAFLVMERDKDRGEPPAPVDAS